MKIYTLRDPDTLEVRYVGFTGQAFCRRLARHISDSKLNSIQTHKVNWIRSLLSRGKKPEITLVENVSADNWQERERFWISHFRNSGCDLTNSCDGGEGIPNPSPETRRKIGAATRSRCGSDRIGKRHSDETKAKLRAANLGKHLSAEHHAKLLAANTGRIPSEETRAKIRNAKTGMKHTPEARAKMRAARVGMTLSSEHCERISAALGTPVVEKSTGKVFQSIRRAAISIGVSHSQMSHLMKRGVFVLASEIENSVKGVSK